MAARKKAVAKKASAKKPMRDERGNPTSAKEVYQDANSAMRGAMNKRLFYPDTAPTAKVRAIPGYVKAATQGAKDAKASAQSRYSRLTGGGSAPGRSQGPRAGGGGLLGRGK